MMKKLSCASDCYPRAKSSSRGDNYNSATSILKLVVIMTIEVIIKALMAINMVMVFGVSFLIFKEKSKNIVKQCNTWRVENRQV